MYLLVFHAYINEIHGSRSKIPSKNPRPYIYYVKFLALLGAPYIYAISRLRVKLYTPENIPQKNIHLYLFMYLLTKFRKGIKFAERHFPPHLQFTCNLHRHISDYVTLDSA
jgi:hypothetical protein